MSSYINKEKICTLLEKYSTEAKSTNRQFYKGFKAATTIIQAEPTIEQLPQKRATWFTYWVGNEKEFCECANCGNEIPPNEKYFQKYCYECGAKMLVLEDLV